MKFEEALTQKGITIDDLPKPQQKKIVEIENFKIRLDAMQPNEDADEEQQKDFEELKAQIKNADEEVADFIENFDVEKYRRKVESIAEARRKKEIQQTQKEENLDVQELKAPEPPKIENEKSVTEHIKELEKEVIEEKKHERPRRERPVPPPREQVRRQQRPIPQVIKAEAEEFEKITERKPRRVNVPLIVMGVGALILTWGAVNFFKERR